MTRVQEFRPPHHRRVDVVGFVDFTIGLVALVYGLIDSGFDGWGATKVVVALIVAAVALGLFPVIESVVKQPMFKLSLFRKPTFVGGSLAAFAMNGSLFAMFLYVVLYFQNALHYSALGSGWRLAIITAGSFITAMPAGRLSARVPVRFLVGPGLLLVGIGLLLMRGLSASDDWTHLIPGFIVAGFGSGLVNPPLASTAVGVVAPQDSGMASGINTTFRQVGIATAVAALGSIWASKLTGITPATVGIHYADALNDLFLITAIVALLGGVIALVAIRSKDFHVQGAESADAAAPASPSAAGTDASAKTDPSAVPVDVGSETDPASAEAEVIWVMPVNP